jgi:hypothetical protein
MPGEPKRKPVLWWESGHLGILPQCPLIASSLCVAHFRAGLFQCRADILGFKAFRQEIGTNFKPRNLTPKIAFEIQIFIYINVCQLMGIRVLKFRQPLNHNGVLFRKRRTR